ncbi:Lrp/AsnC family transcriptional regulator [Martelella alba]|uniref:Lrp/AsnC family transcriptional regulator n=1 Tax=Martelella alba TaxID=2590451 RepID=A0A506UGU2_9HYPH|nr:Lrp/AsnC family transcriptional regulator [Martelella alba]TPW31407.1 Lrp/AsnC family transcriptional regulator [Martelella alba]
MSSPNRTTALDETDSKLLAALAGNARLSLKELAALAGLSSPSAAERIRRLEERGIISGYAAEIDLAAVGYPMEAFVRVKPLPGMLHIIQSLIEAMPLVIECDKVTGDDCFFIRLVFRSMQELDDMLDPLIEKAATSTSIIKSSPVKRRLPPL